MPEVFIYMFEGRNLEQKRKLAAGVTKAVSEALDVDENVVTVQLIEGSKENRSKGGVLFADLHKESK